MTDKMPPRSTLAYYGLIAAAIEIANVENDEIYGEIDPENVELLLEAASHWHGLLENYRPRNVSFANWRSDVADFVVAQSDGRDLVNKLAEHDEIECLLGMHMGEYTVCNY